ncbi:MAG TPA: LON peptidase substrate-binding domain-containing protein, partial [Lachnoclostridium phocaeense]|nr:LON peptidase substrate-binding domain-containing protein [Lachnoclostridium phocaeense]
MTEREVRSLPMVALRGMTVMPEMVTHFDVSRERSIEAIEEAMQEEGQKIFLTAQKDIEVEEPTAEDLYQVGTIASIRQIIKLPRNLLRVLISGEERAVINTVEFETPYMRANVTVLPDTGEEALDASADQVSQEAMTRGLKEIYGEYAGRLPKYPKDMLKQVQEYTDLAKVVDWIAANVPLEQKDLQELLEETDLLKRYQLLAFKLVNEMQIMNIKEEIQTKVRERVDQNQREYILREQLKLIREELGEENTISDAEEFQAAADKLQASDEVKEKLQKEIGRFKSSLNSPAENGVIRTYIETMLEMPWDKATEDHKDIVYAKQVLEEDHYGLEQVKERVLEFLAVRALTRKGESPILCLVGPPGTGKTSIARSLARALKKPYVRISLGGVRDEAEIRGHRKTYVGAMPGRIAAGIRSAGVKNPLMLLDEIDKVSNDYKGDTFSALLEVLDSEQNYRFRDHYLEVPLDLSEVLFVTTANTLQTIPRPLLDRMEVIEVSSYT